MDVTLYLDDRTLCHNMDCHFANEVMYVFSYDQASYFGQEVKHRVRRQRQRPAEDLCSEYRHDALPLPLYVLKHTLSPIALFTQRHTR
jgi:hypothetical protein